MHTYILCQQVAVLLSHMSCLQECFSLSQAKPPCAPLCYSRTCNLKVMFWFPSEMFRILSAFKRSASLGCVCVCVCVSVPQPQCQGYHSLPIKSHILFLFGCLLQFWEDLEPSGTFSVSFQQRTRLNTWTHTQLCNSYTMAAISLNTRLKRSG